MEKKYLSIESIPALLYKGTNLNGAPQKAYLFVHGKCGSKEEAESFAEIVCPKGCDVISIDLPEHGERKKAVERLNPWTVIPELRAVFAFMAAQYADISVRATSIGSWLCMQAFQNTEFASRITKCLFVSPVLDMHNLIQNMMKQAAVTESQLQQAGEIPTSYGETLSWKYLSFVKEHPVANWTEMATPF